MIPHFGILEGLSSDNGSHFASEIVQGVLKILKVKWDLHTAWRPQSTSQVERMNQTLKKQNFPDKICQETQLKWREALPIALLRISIAPRAMESVSPSHYRIVNCTP